MIDALLKAALWLACFPMAILGILLIGVVCFLIGYLFTKLHFIVQWCIAALIIGALAQMLFLLIAPKIL